MADVVLMPQLGEAVDSCVVSAWHVRVGDVVEPTTVVADIETEKSSMEVQAGHSGVIVALLASQGDEVGVRAPFFIIGTAGEKVESTLPAAVPAITAAGLARAVDQSEIESVQPIPGAVADVVSTQPVIEPDRDPVEDGSDNELEVISTGEGAALDQEATSAVSSADTPDQDAAAVLASGDTPSGGIESVDPQISAAIDAPSQPRSSELIESPEDIVTESSVEARAGGSSYSPRALRLASARGVDLAQVTGSGPHGRVLASDVAAVLRSRDQGDAVADNTGAEESDHREATGASTEVTPVVVEDEPSGDGAESGVRAGQTEELSAFGPVDAALGQDDQVQGLVEEPVADAGGVDEADQPDLDAEQGSDAVDAKQLADGADEADIDDTVSDVDADGAMVPEPAVDSPLDEVDVDATEGGVDFAMDGIDVEVTDREVDSPMDAVEVVATYADADAGLVAEVVTGDVAADSGPVMDGAQPLASDGDGGSQPEMVEILGNDTVADSPIEMIEALVTDGEATPKVDSVEALVTDGAVNPTMDLVEALVTDGVTEPPTLTDPSTDMDRSVTTDQAGLTGVQECDEPAPEPVYVDDIIVGDESTAHSGETAGSDPAGSLDSETGSDERDESASHASESPEDESETTMSIDDFDGVAMMAVPAPVVGGSDSVTPDLAAVTVAAENQGSDESEPNPLGHVQLTFTASASATSLMALRARFKAAPTAWGLADVTIGDLVCFAAVRALRQFPAMNAAVRGAETGSGSVVDLGIAVDTGHGLVHPTIRDAGMMGLKQLSRQTKALAEQARSGDISPALLTGSTFAVTNLGAFGIESFTAILHAPQVAILGVNAIQPRAVVHPDGSYGAEQAISFSLTVDHAVVDEADAARYLQSLCAIIADLDLVIMADGGLDH